MRYRAMAIWVAAPATMAAIRLAHRLASSL
jgi:hypothetical protein